MSATTQNNHPALTATDPVELVKRIYLKRLGKNDQYSLAAFARDLGISHVQVCRILNRTRNLTLKQANVIATALHFSKKETETFTRNVVTHSPVKAKISRSKRELILNDPLADETVGYTEVLETARFQAIAKWHHLAILNLTYVKDFDPAPRKIAKQLNITPIEAQDAVERLLTLGLLEKTTAGKLVPTQTRLFVKTTMPDPATFLYENEMLEKAKMALADRSETAFQKRMINGATFPCAPKHLPEIKKRIKKFHEEILELIRPGPFEEVYQLNCQLFPLTKSTGEKK
jgi:uncharacterized protein (TIGR02147 family)